MKQVIFNCEEEVYKKAKLMLPLHGQMSAYLRSSLKMLAEKPDEALRMVKEVADDIRGIDTKADRGSD